MGTLDIAITGAGVCAALGHESDTLFAKLLAGESGIKPIDGFDTTAFPCRIGATVSDFKARDWVSNRKNLKLMSSATRYGLAAVKRADLAAQLRGPGLDPERLGMFVGAGTSLGRTEDLVPALKASFKDGAFDPAVFGTEGMTLINPLWLLKGLSNNVLGFATADLDARGANQNYCNSAVGGLQAIGEGAWVLAEGIADAVLAGGADATVEPAHMTGFGRLNMLCEGEDPTTVRAFDVGHSGFAPGDGAAFFALETPARARERGQQILGRIVGYSGGCSGKGQLFGDPSVIAATCERALANAGWTPAQVDLIYAHGNGTPAFDRAESAALAAVFGEGPEGPLITTNKPQLGHTIAASGPLSVACALEAARLGIVPAIAHLERVDPECAALNYVIGQPRTAPIRRALVHAAGLGGQTTFLALEFDS